MVDAAWISQKTLRLASAPAAIHCKARRLKRCTAPRQVWVAQAGVGGPGRCGRVSEPEVVGLALGQVDVDVIDALDRQRGKCPLYSELSIRPRFQQRGEQVEFPKCRLWADQQHLKQMLPCED